MSITQRRYDIQPGNPEFCGAYGITFTCPKGTPTAELEALLTDKEYTHTQRKTLPTHDEVQFLYF